MLEDEENERRVFMLEDEENERRVFMLEDEENEKRVFVFEDMRVFMFEMLWFSKLLVQPLLIRFKVPG